MPSDAGPSSISDPGALRPDAGGRRGPVAALLDMPGPTLACLSVCLTGLAVLVAVILTTSAGLWYDEVWYLRSVPELQRLGLSREFLRGLPGPAGPLYAIVHAVFAALTGLEAPGVRLVTFGLSLLMFLALGAAMRLRGIPYAIPKAMGFVAAPMAWGPIATAMTEMPSLLFFCASLALLEAGLLRAERGGHAVTAAVFGVLAGLSCGVAIAGRQYFLTIPLASLIVLRRATWPVVSAFVVSSVAVAAPVFLAWGGLVPPAIVRVSGISIAHGILSFSYAGLVYCLYDAGWLLRGWRSKLAVIALAVALNLAFGFLRLVPFLGVAMRYLSPGAMQLYARAGCGAMLGFGILFVAQMGRMAWERRHDAFFLFACAAAAALLAAPAKNAELFVGRYILTAVPLLMIIAAERAPDTYAKAVRLALGCVGGAFSLYAYLFPAW